jgi:NAD-dependent dihydropyrimidine dehydrogenase PreA subunit
MSYIIGNKCIDVCDSACASVCPVDCINGPIYNDKMGNELKDLKESGEIKNLDKPQMYIDPSVCIDCGACLPECPVDAIYEDEEEAIKNNDLESVNRNYNFYNLRYE